MNNEQQILFKKKFSIESIIETKKKTLFYYLIALS